MPTGSSATFGTIASGIPSKPNTVNAAEVEPCLTPRVVDGHVAASNQNQALAALLFLYRDVLKMDLGSFDAVRSRRPKRVPLVLSAPEVAKLIEGLRQLPTEEPY